VAKEEAIEFARKKGMVYIETSAKTKVGIQQTFEEIVQKVSFQQLIFPF
jgi:Ras-related protein Rab-18